MSEVGRYIQIMIDSLKKKIQILDTLLVLNEEQAEAIKDGVKLDAFDELVSKKAEQIELIRKLDTGFDAVYRKVKPEITGHPELHKDEIRQMQELITQLTDRSVKVEASEKRNKMAVEQYFAMTRKNLHTTKKSVSAASNYYKSMTNTQYVDAQMINFKQ